MRISNKYGVYLLIDEWQSANIKHSTKTTPNVRDHASTTKDSANAPLTFGLPYCFYALMGGFVSSPEKTDAEDYSTVTSEGILNLAKRGQLSLIDESEIGDKSKADVLAKGLVCVQVTWMLIQCIARKSAGYPLAMIEVHTLVHVGCALLIYGLWFRVSIRLCHEKLILHSEWLTW